MFTLKLKIKDFDGKESALEPYFLEYGKLRRIAFNQIKKSEILLEGSADKVKNIKHLSQYSKLLDRSFLGWISSDAMSTYKSCEARGDISPVFGGYKNLKKTEAKELDKTSWRKLKNPYIYCVGSKGDSQGNRKIGIDLENKFITFTPKRGIDFKISFHDYSKNYSKILNKYVNLANKNESSITYKISREYIYIMVDECRISDNSYKALSGRILSVDLNPDYIGVSVNDFDKNNKQNTIYSEVIDFSKLNKFKSTNKKEYEKIQACHRLIGLCKHYKVESFVLEKLEIENKDHKKGKQFNKKVNNDWNKSLIINNLQKLCNLSKIRVIPVIAAYSSFVGCLNYPNQTDSIAASLELARRGNLFIKQYLSPENNFTTKKQVLFPEWSPHLMNQWKEDLGSKGITNWKQAFEWFKNKKPKLSYRFLYKDWSKTESCQVLRFKTEKSKVEIGISKNSTIFNFGYNSILN